MKVLKSIFSIVIIFLLCWLVWRQLQHNKAERAETQRLVAQINEVFPVEVAEAQFKKLENATTAVGKLMPHKLMYLISDTQGKVVDLAKRNGDYVKKGEMIAQVDDSPLQNQLALAEASLVKLEKDSQRLNNLLKGEAVTQRQVEELNLGKKNAETNIALLASHIDNSTIKSPMSGHISMLFIEQGSFVGGGMQIAEIVDISQMKLLARVSEEVVVKLKKGQAVTILIDVFPEKKLTGRVSRIAVKSDFGGKYQVEMMIANKQNLALKAGMFAKAKFEEKEQEALVIPRKAIVGSIQNPSVYVLENDKASLKTLDIGFFDSEIVVVEEGLEVGQQVVVNGQINLVEGTQVRILNSTSNQ